MPGEIATVEYFDEMNRVVEGWMRYGASPSAMSKIAQETGISRARVKGYVEEWREIYKADGDVQSRAAEALQQFDTQLSLVQKNLWDVDEDAQAVGDLKTRATVLKSIADIEAKRQDTFQKAGMYDDLEVGDRLAETQEKADAISKLLIETATKYPEAKTFIQEGLTAIFGRSPMVEMPMVRNTE
jgi:hypothetical protein